MTARKAPIDYAQVFGANLRRERMRLGLTLTQLRQRAGVQLSNGYISKLEHGHSNLTIRNCARWAEALGLPLHVLFDPKDL